MGEIPEGGCGLWRRSNHEILQCSTIRKANTRQQKGYRAPRSRQKECRGSWKRGSQQGGCLSQPLRVRALSQVTFLPDFRMYAVLGFSISEPSMVKVITARPQHSLATLSYTSFFQQLLLCKVSQRIKKTNRSQKGKNMKPIEWSSLRSI